MNNLTSLAFGERPTESSTGQWYPFLTAELPLYKDLDGTYKFSLIRWGVCKYSRKNKRIGNNYIMQNENYSIDLYPMKTI